MTTMRSPEAISPRALHHSSMTARSCVAVGQVGHGQRGDAPEQGHGAGGVVVVGQGQRRGRIALLRQHQRRAAGMGGDDQEGDVQPSGDQAGGLDHALGDRPHLAGPRDLRRSPSAAYQRPTATGARSRPARSRRAVGPPCANRNDSASAAIWLMIATASTGYCADRRLAREHHGVGAVEHGVEHVAGLGAGRPAGGLHAVEHLRGRDHRHPRLVAGGDDPLLHGRHPRHVQLDAQVAPRDHHRVGLGDDRVEVGQRLALLDLGDDPGAAAAALQLAGAARSTSSARRTNDSPT